MIQEQIERDLKTALLAGDKVTVETLKGLKSSLQYEAVAKKIKPAELAEADVQAVISREAKKRQEAADLYESAHEAGRSAKELAEKDILHKYLPPQLSEAEVTSLVDEEIAKLDTPSIRDMGAVIGAVRGRSQGAADGALIARLVKERLG